MRLAEARKWIQLCLIDIDAAYGDTVFDEWMIVHAAGLSREVVYYAGPRYDTASSFQQDLQPLKKRLQDRYHVGDLEFAQDAEGTAFDILIMAGDNVFVIFNNTRLSLMAIAKCTTWADAQLPLVKLAEHFNSDPLLLR